MLMVASGPRPGSRPTSVPTVQPMAQYIRLAQVSAWLKPKARLWRASMSVQRQVEAEKFQERQGDEAQSGGDIQVAQHRVLRLAGERRDEDHDDDPRDHVH